ncbi:MAG: hypothetical protein ABIJ74_02035 [archaeon]
MPVKPLPKKLVKRLERASSVILRQLERMKSVDHRFDDPFRRSEKVLRAKKHNFYRGRVRQMNVSKDYSGVELVIKRTHNTKGFSSTELNDIQRMVKAHNERIKRFGKENEIKYVLREPIAYDIGNDLVAMAKTNKPSLREILGPFKDVGNPNKLTLRGIQFFRKLSKKHNVTRKQLAIAAEQVSKETGIGQTNILLLGVNKKGKFIFMPLFDVY